MNGALTLFMCDSWCPHQIFLFHHVICFMHVIATLLPLWCASLVVVSVAPVQYVLTILTTTTRNLTPSHINKCYGTTCHSLSDQCVGESVTSTTKYLHGRLLLLCSESLHALRRALRLTVYFTWVNCMWPCLRCIVGHLWHLSGAMLFAFVFFILVCYTLYPPNYVHIY